MVHPFAVSQLLCPSLHLFLLPLNNAKYRRPLLYLCGIEKIAAGIVRASAQFAEQSARIIRG